MHILINYLLIYTYYSKNWLIYINRYMNCYSGGWGCGWDVKVEMETLAMNCNVHGLWESGSDVKVIFESLQVVEGFSWV